MKRFFFLSLCLLSIASFGYSDEPERDGIWLHERDKEFGNIIRTAELTLTPKAAPKPALKYQLIPDDFDLQDGNAALFYLKAMGFLEQNNAREQLSEFQKKARKAAEAKGEDPSNAAPYSWLSMAPKDIPLEEVKQYLSFLSFQPRDLAEATRKRSFSLDRNIRQVESPISVLLPEIQYMRELARNQKMRSSVAIAEGNAEDAITILGQQLAMANHLGHDEFLVSNLVGAAVVGIAFDDALSLVEMPNAPNLYWAIASLPNPIIDMRSALAFERQFLFEEVKPLKEVDETPRNAGYWQVFIERVLTPFQELSMLGPVANDKDSTRTLLIATIGASYPGSKRFLIEEVGMDRELVNSYTTAQTFFLALKRFYEQTRDEHFKWNSIPFADAMANAQYRDVDARTQAECERIGWSSLAANTFLPSITAARTAQQRIQSQIAMLQTVEAIRMYGAENGGKLPNSLAVLPFPAPVDPATGKPFQYEVNGDKAVLTGYRFPGLQSRLVLKFATQSSK